MKTIKSKTQRSPDQPTLERLRTVVARLLKVEPDVLAAAIQPAQRSQLPAIAAMRCPDVAPEALAGDIAYLEWRYFERDPRAVDLWSINIEGRVLGCIGLEVMDLTNAAGTPKRLRRLQDVIVCAELRQLGVGAWLVLEALARFPDVIAIGSNEQSRSISEKLFHRYEIQKTYKFPLKSEAILTRRLGNHLASRVSARAIDAFNRSRVRSINSNPTRRIRVTHYKDVRRLIEVVATVLPRLSAGAPKGWTPQRDEHYLYWRFAQHPRRTFEGSVARDRTGKVIGYLIWSWDASRLDSESKHGAYPHPTSTVANPSTDAYLFDWRWDPQQATEATLNRLLADCIRRLYDTKAEVVTALTTDPTSERVLKNARFLLRSVDPRFYVHEPDRGAGLATVPGWNLTYADTDRLDLVDAVPLTAAVPSQAPPPVGERVVLRRSDGIAAWEALWKRWLADVEHGYFVSWSWIEHWCQQLPEDIELYLISVEVDGQRAAGVFGEHLGWRNGLVRSHGAFLHRTGASPYDDLAHEYNLILNQSPTAELLEALIDAIPFQWNEIYIIHADEACMPSTLLREECGPYTVRTLDRRPSHYVDLNAVRNSEQGYLPLLSGNTRRSMRKTAKRLLQSGPLALESARSQAEARSIFDELCVLHQQHWQRKGLAGAFADPWILEFHRSLIEKRFQSGEIQFLRLRCGPTTVGCLYNFVYRGEVLFYQSGINYDAFPDAAPGLICHQFAVDFNAAEGHQRYDFLGGDVRYKRSLSTHANQLGSYVIQRRSPPLVLEDAARRLRAQLRPGSPANE